MPLTVHGKAKVSTEDNLPEKAPPATGTLETNNGPRKVTKGNPFDALLFAIACIASVASFYYFNNRNTAIVATLSIWTSLVFLVSGPEKTDSEDSSSGPDKSSATATITSAVKAATNAALASSSASSSSSNPSKTVNLDDGRGLVKGGEQTISQTTTTMSVGSMVSSSSSSATSTGAGTMVVDSTTSDNSTKSSTSFPGDFFDGATSTAQSSNSSAVLDDMTANSGNTTNPPLAAGGNSPNLSSASSGVKVDPADAGQKPGVELSAEEEEDLPLSAIETNPPVRQGGTSVSSEDEASGANATSALNNNNNTELDVADTETTEEVDTDKQLDTTHESKSNEY